MVTKSPLHKRIRLDPSASPSPPPRDQDKVKRKQKRDENSVSGDAEHDEPFEIDDEEDDDHCVICLHRIQDRTVLPCAHDRLCFDCIFVWCQQSRKCPLCNAPIGPFLIHNFRSKYDYSKYYLHPLRAPLPTSASIPEPLPGVGLSHSRGRARGHSSRWGVRRRHRSTSRERRETADELEIAIERRRWVYRHNLYAKHVASNPYTRYRPAPTPAQISASPDLISRATIFVRRELRVWVNLDVEFLTTFILSLMKTLDLRSESAVKLLAEFLDMDTPYYIGNPDELGSGRFANAERFSHELYSYLRSPFRDLAAYDAAVQYDTPQNVSPASLRDSVDLQAQDVDSPRHRDRSPRGRSSPSGSPARGNSHHSRRYSPRPGPAQGSHWSPNRNRNNKRAPLKGKASASSASKREQWREENQFAYTPPSGGPPHRARDQSDDRYEPSPSRDLPQNPSRASDVDKRAEKARSDRADSPPSASAAFPSTDANRQGPRSVTGHISLRDEEVKEAPLVDEFKEGPYHKVPDPRSETVAPTTTTTTLQWGISIRGEAKRLGHLRQSTPPETEPGSQAKPIDVRGGGGSTLRKRQRGAAALDVLHAHLGYVPSTSAMKQSESTKGHANGATLGGSVDEPRITIKGNRMPSDETHLPPDSTVLSQPSPNLPPDAALSSSSSSSPSTPYGTSARDIMARTRAKLARLRAEVPGGSGGDSGTPECGGMDSGSGGSGGGGGGGVSTSMGLRARLVERLEEEKRRAMAGEGEATAVEPAKDSPPPEQQPTLVESKPSAGGTGEAQQVEMKLRAQALMRVRLAAEKKKRAEDDARFDLAAAAAEEEEEGDVDVDADADADAVRVREEALRTRLLSRRGVV